MALSPEEIISQDTLDLLTELTNSPFPIGYARISEWRIHIDDPSFNATLNMYFNEATRNDKPASAILYGIGCNLTQELAVALQDTDDRNIIYKMIEYIIHFQYFEKRLINIEDASERLAFVTEKNAALDELDNDLKIDLYSLFKLQEGENIAPVFV
jgi:hypothetical protein